MVGFSLSHTPQELISFFIKDNQMTQAQNKDQADIQKQTPQQHHQQAAEHHEEAAKHHKEAGKCCGSNDNKTAAHHAQMAQGHSVQATEQAGEASKKYADSNCQQKS